MTVEEKLWSAKEDVCNVEKLSGCCACMYFCVVEGCFRLLHDFVHKGIPGWKSCLWTCRAVFSYLVWVLHHICMTWCFVADCLCTASTVYSAPWPIGCSCNWILIYSWCHHTLLSSPSSTGLYHFHTPLPPVLLHRFVPFSHTTAPSPSSQVCTIFICYCSLLLQQVCTILTLYSHFFPPQVSTIFTLSSPFSTQIVLFAHCHFFQHVCTVCTLSSPFSTGLYHVHNVLAFFNRFVPFSHCPHLFQQVCTICALSSHFSSGLYHLHSPHIFNWFVPFAQSSHFQLVCAIFIH